MNLITKLLPPKVRYNKVFKFSWSLLAILTEMFILTLAVVTIVYFVMSIVPGANSITAGITDPDIQKTIEHQYGYDRSVAYRYWVYITNVFHGQFGISTSILPNQDISVFVWGKIAISMTIGLSALALSLAIGFPLGLFVGQRQGKLVDTFASTVTAFFISMPSLIFALILLIAGRSWGVPYIFDKGNLATYFLPLIAIVIPGIFGSMKVTRLMVVSEVNAQYSKLAQVKGVKKTRFVWTHAIRPASFLIISGLPGMLVSTMFGSMFIEQIFQIPGTGALLINAITSKDINVIIFIVMMLTILTVGSYKMRDALYKVLDPRMRGQ